MYKTLVIEYGDDFMPVEYQLRDYPVVQRWAERVVTAQQQYSIDDPERFYGFGTYEDQVADALERINHCITLIKLRHPAIAVGYVTDVHDQDRLNYWHHVFEHYHGLLEKQSGSDLDSVLAELNICVHRCESIARGAKPRHVVTYYGLPKTELLHDDDYEHFTNVWEPGTVFLNYAEIGKTLEDLAYDNDQYIQTTAYQPYTHISADFNVKFYAQTELQAKEKDVKMFEYYNRSPIGPRIFGPWGKKIAGGHLPLADIVGPVDLEFFETRQEVKTVTLK